MHHVQAPPSLGQATASARPPANAKLHCTEMVYGIKTHLQVGRGGAAVHHQRCGNMHELKTPELAELAQLHHCRIDRACGGRDVRGKSK